MLKIEFNAAGPRGAIRQALGTLEDMTPIYDDIGEYMIDATRKRFLTGTAPDGSAWALKSEATLERYKRMGYESLTRPLIGPGKALSRQILKFVSRSGVVIGSALEYSAVMQEGAARGAFGNDRRGHPIPWGTIPARVWLGIGAADEAAIIETIDEHLAKDLSKPG